MRTLHALFLMTAVVAAGCTANLTAMPDNNGEPVVQSAPALEDSKVEQNDVSGIIKKILGVSEDYKIGPGDILEVSVYGEESLSRKDLVVRPDGKVSFPLLGDVQVGGLTTAQAKAVLEQGLHAYIREATASVSVTQLGSLQYYVVGKVNKPGMYNVSKPLTVLQALAMAGGLTPFASESRILILRNSGKDTVRLTFNYKQIIKGEDISQNIVLERGDVVVVP